MELAKMTKREIDKKVVRGDVRDVRVGVGNIAIDVAILNKSDKKTATVRTFLLPVNADVEQLQERIDAIVWGY